MSPIPASAPLLGFIASLIVYPHTISDARLRLRFSVFQDITIPTETIESIQKFRDNPESTNSAACIDGKLIMTVASQANIKLELDKALELTSLDDKLASQAVKEVIFYTDDDATAETWPRDRAQSRLS